MTWLTGWTYRKSHVITAQTGAGTGYQKQIKVHYGSGSDSGEDVYCNSHCKTDFGDIRFTDDDGNTELDYWLQEKVDNDYAIFWVEIADTLESNATIYVYYGKSDATTTSNFNATFPLNQNDYFDDQTTNTTPTGWSAPAGGTFYVATDQVKHGAKSAKHYSASTTLEYQSTKSVGPNLTNVAIMFWIRKGDNNVSSQKFYLKDGATEGLAVGLLSNGYISYYKNGWQNIIAYSANTWYKLEFNNFNWTTRKADVYVDDVLRKAGADFVSTAANIDTMTESIYKNGSVWLDSIIIRKYVSPEPVHSTWGGSELSPISLTQTILFSPQFLNRIYLQREENEFFLDTYVLQSPFVQTIIQTIMSFSDIISKEFDKRFSLNMILYDSRTFIIFSFLSFFINLESNFFKDLEKILYEIRRRRIVDQEG